MLITSAALSQVQRVSVSVPSSQSATAVLANFEKMTSIGRAVTPDEVRYPDRYSVARVDSVLDGLIQIAQASKSGFRTASAVMAIMKAGSAERPQPGAFDREVSFYRRSKNTTIQGTILTLMFEQKDRPRAIAFLRSVAMQSGDQRDYEYAPYEAAQSLSHMGNDGRAVLLDLQNKKLLQDGRTGGFTHWFLSTKGSAR